MKVIRLFALVLAAFFVLLAPTAAQAYPGDEGNVSATPPVPSGNGCYTSSVTVQGAPGETLTLTVINADGEEVYSEQQAAGVDGSATFTVELCEPGSYLASGEGSESGALGSSEITIPQGSQGGGSGDGSGTTPSTGSTGSGSGNLPATGADSGTMLTLAGALALLMVGGVTLVAAKRKAL